MLWRVVPQLELICYEFSRLRNCFALKRLPAHNLHRLLLLLLNNFHVLTSKCCCKSIKLPDLMIIFTSISSNFFQVSTRENCHARGWPGMVIVKTVGVHFCAPQCVNCFLSSVFLSRSNVVNLKRFAILHYEFAPCIIIWCNIRVVLSGTKQVVLHCVIFGDDISHWINIFSCLLF